MDPELIRSQRNRIDAEQQQLRHLADQIKKPSLLLFVVVFVVVGIAEVIDIIAAISWLATLLSGGAAAPAPIISETASAIVDFVVLIILLISGYISSRHLKNAQKHREEIGKSIASMEQRIAKFRQHYVFALKMGRKVPFLRKPLAKAALKFRAAKLISTKNPIIRNMLRTAADIVPIVSIWPFRTIGVYRTYKEEKQAYEQRGSIQDSWMAANMAEIAEENQLIELQAQEQEEQAEEEELAA